MKKVKAKARKIGEVTIPTSLPKDQGGTEILKLNQIF